MLNADIISMPDKWEYPWYAAWDLAFHTLSLSLVDFDFAKEQLLLMLRSLYFHPNGQIPAYEWNFSDVNPPVHAWATLYLYKMERALGRSDLRFLERVLPGADAQLQLVGEPQGSVRPQRVRRRLPGARQHRRVRPQRAASDRRLAGAGGRHGLDGVLLPVHAGDGAHPVRVRPDVRGGRLQVRPALHAGSRTPWTGSATITTNMWDEEDGFFYDVLRLPDGNATRLKVRSMVGLLPLCASTVFEADVATRYPRLDGDDRAVQESGIRSWSRMSPRRTTGFIGYKGRRLLSLLNRKKLESVLGYLLDENEFLGPYGIRSLSRYHLDHPFSFWVGGQEYNVQYLPAESEHGHVRRELQLARSGLDAGQRADHPRAAEPLRFYGDDFKVECPTGSGNYMTLFEVAHEIAAPAGGHLPARRGRAAGRYTAARTKFQDDPHWRDLILFYEYFHGDNGAGLGASHQTGWTGLVALMMDIFGRVDAKKLSWRRP